MTRWLAAALVMAVSGAAAAEPLLVVVRDGGPDDDVVAGRLEGHLVDVEAETIVATGALEATLDAQIATATRLAAQHAAAAVLWFRIQGDTTVVIVATPRERRIFVREIDAGDASATAEAAAQAARTAIRALSLGGTIGVEVPEPAPLSPAVTPAAPRWRWSGAVGWQLAADRGADIGAHASWQRVGLARGRWGAALALSLGPSLARDGGEVDVVLARHSMLAVVEHRRGAWAFGAGAGAIVYRRSTVGVPMGLEPTPTRTQVAFAIAPELRWVATRGRWGLEVAAGLDLVIGAPELAIERGGQREILTQITALQPRIGLGIRVEP